MDPKLVSLVTLLAAALSALLNLLVLAGMWGVFTKARRPGWEAVPVWANYVLTVSIARLPVHWFYLQFAPAAAGLVAVVLSCAVGSAGDGYAGLGLLIVGWAFTAGLGLVVWGTVCVGVARAFRRDAGFGVGLTLLPYVYFPLLGFNDDLQPPRRARRRAGEAADDADDADSYRRTRRRRSWD